MREKKMTKTHKYQRYKQRKTIFHLLNGVFKAENDKLKRKLSSFVRLIVFVLLLLGVNCGCSASYLRAAEKLAKITFFTLHNFSLLSRTIQFRIFCNENKHAKESKIQNEMFKRMCFSSLLLMLCPMEKRRPKKIKIRGETASFFIYSLQKQIKFSLNFAIVWHTLCWCRVVRRCVFFPQNVTAFCPHCMWKNLD